MLERYITPLLTSYLDKYVKNIKPTDLQLSFWGGDAVLRNLELRLDVLEKEMGYPLALQSGHVKELRIHVPWTTLGSEPVEITISDVEVFAVVKESWSMGDSGSAGDLSGEVKETIKKTELQQGSADQAPGYLSGLLNRILNNIVYHIKNVVVKLTDDDIILSITADFVESFSTNEFWNRMFIYTDSLQGDYSLHGECIWKDVVISLDQLSTSGHIEQFQEPFVNNFGFTMRTQKDFKGGHRVSNTINFLSDVMDFSLTETQYCLFMRILDRIFALYYSTKKLKGKEAECFSPALSSSSQDEKFYDVGEGLEDTTTTTTEEPKQDGNSNSEGWGSWMWSFVGGAEDTVNQTDTGGQPPKSSFELSILVNKVTIDFKRTCKRNQGVFFAAPKISAQSVVLFHISGCCFKLLTEPTTQFYGFYTGFMGLWAELTGDCCCATEGSKTESSSTDKSEKELVVLTIGPHGRDMVDTSRLPCGTLFDNSSSVDVTTSRACTSDDFPAVWFSYDYYDVSKERTQEELAEHFDFGQVNVVLCAELVHFWQHFSESRNSSLEANPSLSGGMIVIGDIDAHTEVYTTIKKNVIYVPTSRHQCYSAGARSHYCVRIDTEGYMGHTSKPMYPGNATHDHIQRTKSDYKVLPTIATFSRVSEGWEVVAHGNSDTLVTSVTTTPAIVEVTRLSATRHWQDNGKTIISSYTELSCPSGIVRCNAKELLQLVDWCQSWYVETNTSLDKDRTISMDDTSHKDKLTLTITEATWQHTDTLSVVTHSVILHHFDVSMSCDTLTTTPTSKLIRGPVITRGNKEAFRTNMGTLVLPDCDGNVLEAYCAYPTGKGNEENFSTIQVKLLGVVVCFHPLLLTFLKSLPPDLVFSTEKEATSTEGLLTTASAVNETDAELNDSDTDNGEKVISLLQSFVVEANLEPVILVFPNNSNNEIDSIPYDYWQLHGAPTIPMLVAVLPSIVVTSSGGLPLDEPSSRGSLEDTFPWRACVEGLCLYTVTSSCRHYICDPVAMDLTIATVRSSISTEVGIGIHADVQPIVMSMSHEQAKLVAVTIKKMMEVISSVWGKHRTVECDESGFVSQSQPTASLSPSPTQSVVTVSTMPTVSVASSQLPASVPSFWLQLTLSKLTLILFSMEPKEGMDAEEDEATSPKRVADDVAGMSSVECALNDVSCSLDVQEQQFKAEVKVVSADAQLKYKADQLSTSCRKLFSSHTSILDLSISTVLSNLMADLHEPEPQSTQRHSSSHSFLSFSYISYSNTNSSCKAPKIIVELKPFELLLWLPIVRYVDGVTNQLTNLIGQNQNEFIEDEGDFVWPTLDVKVDCFRIIIPDGDFNSALLLSVDSACLTSSLDYPISRMIVNSSLYKKLNTVVHDHKRPRLPAYQLDICSMGCWGYQGNGSKLTNVLPIMLSCELRVLFSPALLLAGSGTGKVPLVACGNSVEVNISSNVTVFVGQQHVELVSAIVKSTTSSTNSTSASNTTDVSVVSLPMATIPYQVIISGNKVMVFVLSSSRETHQLLSPSVKASSSSKLYPLLRLCIDHPLITMTTNNDNVKYNISCYDAHVDLSIGGKNCTSYGELKSNELYTFAMMDTRKGQPQATGIMPSLLVLDYHVTTSKLKRNTWAVSIELGKPLHITLTPDLVNVVNTLKMYTNIVTDSTLKPTPEVTDKTSPMKHQYNAGNSFSLKLTTDQCLFEIGISKFRQTRKTSVAGSYPYLVEKGVVLSWSSVNAKFPEDDSQSSTAITSTGLLSTDGVQLHLVVEKSELPCLCNSHLDVKVHHHSPISLLDQAEFFIMFSSSSLHILISNDHLVAATELHTTYTEVLSSLDIGNSRANVTESSGTEPSVVKKKPTGVNTKFTDDLRCGDLVYVFGEESDYQVPLPGQIVFNEGKDSVSASSMEWCYYEPRVVTNIQVAPVPFNVSSNQAATMDIQIGCLLQYWDVEEQDYLTLKSFTLTECTTCSVELDNGKNILPSCRQWRVVIDEVEWTGESEDDWRQLAENAGFPAPLSVILSPVVLAASTRIDSVHNSNLAPSMMLHSEFEKLSVKFIFFNRHREKNFEGYDIIQPSPIEQELFEFCASDFSLRSRRWTDGTISGTIRSSFDVDFVDFRDLSWRRALECAKISIGIFQQCNMDATKPESLKLEASIKADVLSLHVSQGLVHTLSLAHHMWTTSEPVTLLTHYIICNDTVEDLHFGQSATEEDIFLPSRSCHGYTWRTNQIISQEMHVCLVNEGMWRWTKPFAIDTVGIQTVPLHIGSSYVTTLYVEITLLGGLQRVVTFRGSWMFTSYLPCPVEVGLVTSVQLDQEEEELEEIRGWGSGCVADDDQSAVIPSCSSLPSMLAAEDKFAGVKFRALSEARWSRSFPLSSRSQLWNKPSLLVDMPCNNDSIMHCWFTLEPVYSDRLHPSPTKIVLCPLFGAVNHLPFDLILHSTSYDEVPPSPSKTNHLEDTIDHADNGKLHKPTVLNGRGVFTQLPHFYADIWHQLQLVYCGEDEVVMEPVVSVSSTMLHELPVADLSYEQLASFSQQWPYCDVTTPPDSMNGSARVSLLQLPLSSTQYCTILASLIRTASNTILLELHSQCLLVNHTSTAILVKEKDRTGKGMLQRSLEDTETMIPSSDELVFGVRWQNYELWSSVVNLSSLAVMKDEKNDDGSSGRSPPVIVKCRSADMKVIAEFQAVASKHRGITVVCIKPQYVLLNQTDWQLRVCPLQLVPKYAVEFSYEELFPLALVAAGESWPMLFWHCSHTSEPSTDTICLSANAQNIQWSLPLSLKFVRRSFALPLGKDEPTSTPALITSHQAEDGSNYLVVSLDPSPRLLIQNLTNYSIEITEAGSKGVHAVPQTIEPGCESVYEPPTLAKTYPVVLDDDNEVVAELKMSVNNLKLALKTTKDRAWSRPIHPLVERDMLLELPSGIEMHLTTFKTQNSHHITLLPTGGVTPALPIPAPVQAPPSKSNTELLFELDVSQIFIKVEDDMANFSCIEEVLRISCDEFSVTYNTIGSSGKGKLSGTLGALQIDNMINQCECEVVLIARSRHNRRASLYASTPAPLIQCCCDFSAHNFSHVDNLYVAVEPITIQIEDELINLVRYLVHSYTVPGVLTHSSTQPDITPRSLSPTLLTEATRDTKPLVISHFKIKPIMLYVSARVSVKILLSCDDSPLSFEEYSLNDVFSNWPELLRVLAAHYTAALIMRAGWVVGSIELIGSPSTLIRSVGTGLHDLVTLPYEGLTRSPSLFIWGISKGTAAFVRQVSSGALRSLTSMAGSLSRNMERLSMDEEHVKNLNYNRRNRPATHITSGLTSGASSLGLSILGAIAGIIEQPLQGIQQSDDSGGMIAARGLVVGLGKGLLGAVTKPVGGAMEFVSQTGHGIMHGTGLTTMLKRRTADLQLCRKDRSSTKSTTTKYIWKVFCMPHNSIIMSVEAHFISSTGRHFPCLLLLSATTLYIVNTSADTVEHSYQCVHFDLRTSSEEWELPKDVDTNKDKAMLLTLVSRQQLFIDVSSEQRVQTYLQLAPESSYGRGSLVAKMAFLCDDDQAKRLLVHYFMLQTYLLQPDAIFQAHSLASAEWEKIVQLKEAGSAERSLKASSQSSL